MSIPTNIPYFPILKTTDAELKAFEHLDAHIKANIIPIFELTRSRRSPKNMDRCISKRLSSLKELMNNRPFVLDLTTDPQLSNEQIDNILEYHSNGFPLWIDLIKQNISEGLNIIPVIHYDETNLNDVKIEISKLFELSEILAFRVSPQDAISYLHSIKNMGFPLSKIILILDANYKDHNNPEDKSKDFADTIDEILKDFSTDLPLYVLCAFSSYPSSVTKIGNEKNGSWERHEKIVFNTLYNKYKDKINLHHSDYSSVHPIRYNTAGGKWIPRIDFLDDNKMHYFRCRREDGGYICAAKQVVSPTSHYSSIKTVDCWGDSEIYAASQGNPNGNAPSHWIAVRINLYITKTLSELTDLHQNLL